MRKRVRNSLVLFLGLLGILFFINVASAVGVSNPNCGDYSAPSVPAPLRTIYVDAVVGNDANDGLTPGTAVQTLEPRANVMAQAGDLFLISGTFNGQFIRPGVSGTAANKIVYKVKPGETAVIDGGKFGTTAWLDDRDHIVVDGLELTGDTILIQLTDANNNWIRNVYLHDGGGIRLQRADDNRIEDSRIDRIGSEASNSGDSVSTLGGADRNVIVRNTMTLAGHNSLTIGIYTTAGAAISTGNIVAYNDFSNIWAGVLDIAGKADNTLVECNKISNGADGTSVNYARGGLFVRGTNNIVRYNSIFNNGARGIDIQSFRFGGFTQPNNNNHIYGNTLWNNNRGSAAGGSSFQILQKEDGSVRDNIIENNIFWGDPGFSFEGKTFAITVDLWSSDTVWSPNSANGNIFRNNIFPSGVSHAVIVIRTEADGGNLFYTTTEAEANLAGWANNLQLDPLYVNPPSDFNLQSGSPAIDAGNVIAGQSFNGAAPDLGAYESTGVPAPTNPGEVTDLKIVAVVDTSVTLSFTEVDDGTGNPAGYVVAFMENKIEWLEATIVTGGSCSIPVAGSSIGAILSCDITGLEPGINYEFQLAGFRGTLGVDAVFGNLSNIVSININKFIYNHSEWWTNETTNFSIYNKTELQSLSDVKFLNQYGKIHFLEKLNFSKLIYDFTDRIKILSHIIFIDSNQIPEFNKSAQLTFRDVGFTNPIIKRDGVDCPATVCQTITFDKTTGTYVFNVSSFTIYEVVEQCSDGIQNYDETGIDCGGSCVACSAGGVSPSGGGGGGGYTPAVATPSIVETQSVDTATPESTVIVKDFDPETGIKQIQIGVKAEVQNLVITVSKYDGRPIFVEEKSGKVYRYLEINTNLGDNLEKAIVTILVEKSWISDNGLTKNDIAVFRFDEASDRWDELETTHTESDDIYHYYDVESTTFSFFTIVGKGGFFEGMKENGLKWWLGGLAIVIILIIVGVIIWRRRRRFQKEETETS